MRKFSIFFILLGFISCKDKTEESPVIKPDVISATTNHDTDDPAIWVNRKDPAQSIVFGTDKDTDGAIYAFDLDGNIIEAKTIRNLMRPNNVDLEYGVKLNDSVKTDIIVFTERERQQIRIFSVPDMQPLDNGGFPVFSDAAGADAQLPMGVAIYKSPETEKTFVIVGRKSGPEKDYLHQYELTGGPNGLEAQLVRKFGNFSGIKEIEAIAVDDVMGYVYYSDEGHCVRKYYAEPSKGNEELACFGKDNFQEDIEGIAIAAYPDGSGQIIVSDQQAAKFNFFSRKNNRYQYSLNLSTIETDGCEVVTEALGEKFPNGLFVAMNDEKNFYFYDFGKLKQQDSGM